MREARENLGVAAAAVDVNRAPGLIVVDQDGLLYAAVDRFLGGQGDLIQRSGRESSRANKRSKFNG